MSAGLDGVLWGWPPGVWTARREGTTVLGFVPNVRLLNRVRSVILIDECSGFWDSKIMLRNLMAN